MRELGGPGRLPSLHYGTSRGRGDPLTAGVDSEGDLRAGRVGLGLGLSPGRGRGLAAGAGPSARRRPLRAPCAAAASFAAAALMAAALARAFSFASASVRPRSQGLAVGLDRLVVEVAIDHRLEVVDLGLGGLGQDRDLGLGLLVRRAVLQLGELLGVLVAGRQEARTP